MLDRCFHSYFKYNTNYKDNFKIKKYFGNTLNKILNIKNLKVLFESLSIIFKKKQKKKEFIFINLT